MEKLLSPDEVAGLIGVKKQTLNVWRSRKRTDLPYIKVGHLVKYRRQDVEDFIERHRNDGEPA